MVTPSSIDRKFLQLLFVGYVGSRCTVCYIRLFSSSNKIYVTSVESFMPLVYKLYNECIRTQSCRGTYINKIVARDVRRKCDISSPYAFTKYVNVYLEFNFSSSISSQNLLTRLRTKGKCRVS